jgi:hypothetical protein
MLHRVSQKRGEEISSYDRTHRNGPHLETAQPSDAASVIPYKDANELIQARQRIGFFLQCSPLLRVVNYSILTRGETEERTHSLCVDL